MLLAAARRAGMNQAQLARRIGRSPQYFNRVITRKVSSAIVWGQAWDAVRALEPEPDGVMSMAMEESKAHAAAR